jgi:hypothetical protein
MLVDICNFGLGAGQEDNNYISNGLFHGSNFFRSVESFGMERARLGEAVRFGFGDLPLTGFESFDSFLTSVLVENSFLSDFGDFAAVAPGVVTLIGFGAVTVTGFGGDANVFTFESGSMDRDFLFDILLFATETRPLSSGRFSFSSCRFVFGCSNFRARILSLNSFTTFICGNRTLL